MELELIPTLADAIKDYLSKEELAQLCGLYDVPLEFREMTPRYLDLAKRLVVEIEHGNNRRFLEAVVPSLHNRARQGLARETFERQDMHRHWVERLEKLEAALGEQKLPSELTVTENRPFTAKSEARELLGQADTEVVVVDNYVGPGTLDCLRDVTRPIRLLTGQQANSVAAGFDRALADFRTEGRTIGVRRHGKLHDRYVVFNDRCWLVGSSLKDAGRKTFSMIEVVDSKAAIVAEIERKWTEAAPLT